MNEDHEKAVLSWLEDVRFDLTTWRFSGVPEVSLYSMSASLISSSVRTSDGNSTNPNPSEEIQMIPQQIHSKQTLRHFDIKDTQTTKELCLNYSEATQCKLYEEVFSLSHQECKRCSEESYEKSIKDIEDLQSKIHNLSIEENLETSLTLAAELGSALLKENCLIKQQLHDLKETKSENLLELEDRLKEELCFMTSKLEEERNLKEDFLLQAEVEKNEFTTKINNLNSEKSVLNTKIQQFTEDLDSKTIYFKKETDRLQLEITALRDTEVVLRTELESRNSLIHSIQTNCQELVLKLDEQECTIRAYLKSVVVNTKSHLNMKLSSSSTTLYKKNSISVLQPPTIYESSCAPLITKTLDDPHHSTISLHDELLSTSKDLMTSGDRQTCNKKTGNHFDYISDRAKQLSDFRNQKTCNKNWKLP
ncbi:hypothetical protein J6590_054295 [Homalodisca vitripennis]|nr:hypothetical protein J6590_054295 [Homalodisca vitripennis]